MLTIVQPKVYVESFDGVTLCKKIERMARICYKSEHKQTDESYKTIIANMLKRGHFSPIEHEKISVIFVCDRGVSHELVRHRIASFSQESTRYCNYSKNQFGNRIQVIEPFGFLKDLAAYKSWYKGCESAASAYFEVLAQSGKPEWARSVLPNSLKTEVATTFNLREWRHFFSLRADKAAHPQMRQVAVPLLKHFQNKIPILFDDIEWDKSFPQEYEAKIIESEDLLFEVTEESLI